MGGDVLPNPRPAGCYVELGFGDTLPHTFVTHSNQTIQPGFSPERTTGRIVFPI